MIFLGFLEGFSYILVRQHTKEEILVVRESLLTTHSPKEGGLSSFMLSPCHTKFLYQSWPILRTGNQDCCGETFLLPGAKLYHTHSCASSHVLLPQEGQTLCSFIPWSFQLQPLRTQTDFFFPHRMLKHTFSQLSQNNSFLGMNASITVFKLKRIHMAK